ncbi:GGDEF domain-containing phosphodiesterase [Thiotrichales bacterium 19S11-10]|nr:GGDEF domain-containing phosphodiesterase [Thiotrichales bacterium 19S11-10]
MLKLVHNQVILFFRYIIKFIRCIIYRDYGTGLPHKRVFEVKLNKIIKQLKLGRINTIGLLFIGIGRLDEIDRTLGYDFSDALILKVIERLKNYSTIKQLARFSDDTLIVLLENKSLIQLEQLAQIIHSDLEDSYYIQSFNLDITPYIGVTLIENANQDAKTWMCRGDHVLYRAQIDKHHVLSYDHNIDRLSPERLSIMGDLLRGLEKDELELWFQPKVSLTGSSSYYVEALVRWRRPNQGIIKPEAFIPLAEETNHIQKITYWALDKTCEYIKQWLQSGYEIKVAVNISAKDLAEEALYQLLKSKINDYKIPAKLLALEVTESDVIKNLDKASLMLGKISDLGVSIVIDDFGVGYSSIAYLRDLPANEIKIDKTFITRLNLEPDSTVIVGSIIELAHKMGLSIVAEGVENEEVIHQLKKYYCDYVQGFYYSEPMSYDELMKWIKQNK